MASLASSYGVRMHNMEPATIPLPKPRPLPCVSSSYGSNLWQDEGKPIQGEPMASQNLPSLLASRTDPFQVRRAPTAHSKSLKNPFEKQQSCAEFSDSKHSGKNNRNSSKTGKSTNTKANFDNVAPALWSDDHSSISNNSNNNHSNNSSTSDSNSNGGKGFAVDLNFQANLFEDLLVFPAAEWDQFPFLPSAPPGLELEGGTQIWSRQAQGLREDSSNFSSETASTADPTEDAPVPAPPTAPSFHHPSLCEAFSKEVTTGMEDGQGEQQTMPELLLPSLGSAAHFTGTCRPCDFACRGVDCRAGSQCQFCHLCNSQERKQRKAQRKKLMKALHRSNNSTTSTSTSCSDGGQLFLQSQGHGHGQSNQTAGAAAACLELEPLTGSA